MKSKHFFTILAIGLFFSGCGSAAHFEKLPQGVLLVLPELREPTAAAIEGLNSALGEVFFISEDETSLVRVECGNDDEIRQYEGGRANVETNVNGWIVSVQIIIKCNLRPDRLNFVIAHELLHALGIEEESRSDDLNCLSHASVPMGESVASMVCPEMIIQFEERYDFNQ